MHHTPRRQGVSQSCIGTPACSPSLTHLDSREKKRTDKNHMKEFGGQCASEVCLGRLGGRVPGTLGTSRPNLCAYPHRLDRMSAGSTGHFRGTNRTVAIQMRRCPSKFLYVYSKLLVSFFPSSAAFSLVWVPRDMRCERSAAPTLLASVTTCGPSGSLNAISAKPTCIQLMMETPQSQPQLHNSALILEHSRSFPPRSIFVLAMIRTTKFGMPSSNLTYMACFRLAGTVLQKLLVKGFLPHVDPQRQESHTIFMLTAKTFTT